MTRFARSKGSKASNERAPEDSTPWEVMKEQLLQAKKDSEDSKNRKQAEQKRIENYENFLKERKVLKRQAVWCDFPETEQKRIITYDNAEPPTKIKKKIKKQKLVVQEPNNDVSMEQNKIIISDSSEPLTKTKKKNKKKKTEAMESKKDISIEENNSTVSNSELLPKPKQMNKKQKFDATEPSNNVNLEQDNSISEPSPKTKKKNKKQKSKTPKPDNVTIVANGNEVNTDAVIKEKKTITEQKGPTKRQRNKKNTDGVPVRRKEINDRSFQLIINGKEIELVRFDGFPVMKKDAERLEELNSSMIKKGIPKSEVQRTIKLERRRAEKALARVKREVCYNCRKGGHVLSDCPELKSKIPGADGADGVCFKCGSTEHRQFECKVQKDKEFRFATCFICKEPGHIARQCPDNPKGLYPNGGSCKLCGDVTHLRKDCPTVTDKKESSTVKLQTLDNGDNIEDVGQQSNKFTPTETVKKPKKIKF